MATVGFLQNPIILSAFFSMLAAQIIKVLNAWRAEGHLHWRYLFLAAGMPSSHTAMVVALSASLYLTEGATNLFIAVSAFSLIVIRDVIGDKAFAQAQENIVNRIFDKITHGQFEAARWNTLIGHTLREVFAGALLGFVVTALVFQIV